MISCAAVQKLERYGQLGLKRNSVDDFVQSSLKDTKRANIFALTHLDTWRECRDYICATTTTATTGTPAPNDGVALQRKDAAVSESLVYAMSFTTALVGEHCHQICRGALHAPASSASAPATAAAARNVIFEGETVQQSWETCVTLVGLLKDIAVTMHRQRARVWTLHGSATLTQAVAHYCATLVDVLVAVSTLFNLTSSSSSSSSSSALKNVVAALSADVFSTLTAAVRHLKRCAAQYPVDTLFHTRTLPAMVRQYVHKQEQQQKQKQPAETFSFADLATSLGVSLEAFQSLPPLISLLLSTSLTAPSCALVMDGCSLFQRLSLLYAYVSLDASAVESHDSTTSATPKVACLVDSIPLEARAQLQTALCTLLAPQACNRATRYVVYYRGDDVRLLQNNVRQPAEYALHTFSTTAPIDPALVTSLSAFLERTQSTSVPVGLAHTNLRCALLVASWMASAPLFFHSFCTDTTWSVFAREQRRMTILNQMKDRRERKQEKRKRKRTPDGHDDDASTAAGSDDASDTASVSSHVSQRTAASLATASGGLLDTMSLASRQTSIGLLSLASRASVLSTLSKRSQASYLSFLSVLKPEGGGGGDGGEGGSAMEEPKLHESADGNTNLPLILLEELVLGLYSVMETYEASVLDQYGLRVLAWQCVGHMLALLQGSMHHREQQNLSAIVTSIPTPLFNLGYDTRYNHGLGYEALGLLFAKVISPQLEGEDAEAAPATAASGEADEEVASDDDTSSRVAEDDSSAPLGHGGLQRVSTPGRPYVSIEKDPASVRLRVEAALSQCLATYEDVAPQVVDANLPVILRIAARAASLDAATSMDDDDHATAAAAPPHVLLTFLAEITTRLGRGNQVPVLLDALLKPQQSSDSTEDSHNNNNSDDDEVMQQEEEMSKAALQRVFAQPAVHMAFTEACALSMDPETLLSHMVAYVAALTSEEADDGPQRSEASSTYVLFVLQLVAALLEGVLPTSVTSAAVLERSTELELLLSAFLMERLAPLLTSSSNDNDNDEEENEGEARTVAARSWRLTAPITAHERDTVLHPLLLSTLYALYQCRQVTRSCLQDLGSSPVTPYLEMLEETLWQCQAQVGVLAGSAFHVADLAAMLRATTKTGVTLTLPMDPHFDAPTLLTLLSVQRLCLARAVSTMLGLEVGPVGEARQMAHYVLDALVQPAGHNDGAAAAQVAVANLLTAEAWQSLCAYGKPKRVRQHLVSLLRLSFDAQAAASLLSASTVIPAPATRLSHAGDSGAPQLPLWLSRCLRVDGGAVLRALVTLLLGMEAETVQACLAVPDAAMRHAAAASAASPHATAVTDARRLLVALDSLRAIYLGCGHLPYWCSLLETVIDWLQAWYKTYTRAHADMLFRAEAANTTLLTALLLLMRDCLVLERRAAETCRRALFELDSTTEIAERAGTAAAAVAAGGDSVSAAQRCRTAYTAALGVPVTIPAHTSAVREPTGAAQDDEDNTAVDTERQEAEALQHAVAALFSPNSRLTRLFWLLTCTEEEQQQQQPVTADAATARRTLLRDTVVSLMAFSYVNALQTAQMWHRMQGNAQASGNAACSSSSSSPSRRDASAFIGYRYVHHVADQFTARLSGEDTSAGSASRMAAGATLAQFLSTMEGKSLVLPVSGASNKRTRGRPSRSDQEKADATDASPDPQTEGGEAPLSAAQVMSLLFQRWLTLLRDQLCVILAEDKAPQDEAILARRCDWVNALYGHLLDAFLVAYKQANALPLSSLTAAAAAVAAAPVPGKRKRETEDGTEKDEQGLDANADDKTDVATRPPLHKSQASDSATQFIHALLYPSEDAASATSPLPALLARVFTQTDGTTSRHARAGSRLLARLVSVETTTTTADEGKPATLPGLTTAWLLLKLHEVVAKALSSVVVQPLQRALCAALPTLPEAIRNSANSNSDSWSRGVVSPCTAPDVVRRLEAELRTLTSTLHLMHANAVPAALHHYMHALFNDALPHTATQDGLALWLGCTHKPGEDVSNSAAARLRGHALLTTVADALLAISAVPGMRMASLVYVLKRLLWAATALQLPAGAVVLVSDTLRATLLKLCALPSPALTRDNGFLDAVWWFLLDLLEARTEDVTLMSALSPVRASSAALRSHVISFEEVMLVLRLLTQTWLRAGIMWRTPGLVPNLLAALFEVVMHGVREKRYPPHTVLNALASFLFQLVKDVEFRRRQRGAKDTEKDEQAHDADQPRKENAQHDSTVKRARRESGGADAESHKNKPPTNTTSGAAAAAPSTPLKLGHQSQETQAAASLDMASTSTQYLALAAATAAVFEVAQSYISIFTTYSNDMDYLASDLLKALSRVHLPRKIAPPIAYHAGTRIVNHGLSAHTYSDLAFTAVGSGESKALLRQAALRIEEEQEDLVDESAQAWAQDGGNGAAVGRTSHRNIFRVAE